MGGEREVYSQENSRQILKLSGTLYLGSELQRESFIRENMGQSSVSDL